MEEQSKSIDLLLSANVDDIDIEATEGMGGIYDLHISVNGTPIKIKGLYFKAEDKSIVYKDSYQLHIQVPSNLRQKGIAGKLYTAFLKKCGNIVSLYGNRVGSYAKEQNQSKDFDGAIDKMLISAARNANASIDRLYPKNSEKEIGILVYLD